MADDESPTSLRIGREGQVGLFPDDHHPPNLELPLEGSYDVRVITNTIEITAEHLVPWNRLRRQRIAKRLVKRALGDAEPINLGTMLPEELQDCIDRAAERFCPGANVPLQLYWNASRGLYTYYSALELGADSKRGYLGFDALGSIGEGVALFVLEHDAFGLDLLYRPLSDSPDLLMIHSADPDRIALVEAKAVGDGQEFAGALADAVFCLLDILRGWHLHQTLEQTDGFAVVTSFSEREGVLVHVVKLAWRNASNAA